MERMFAIWILGVWSAGALGGTICHGIPSGDPEPAVSLCEEGTDYVFDLAGDVYRYDRASWQRELRLAVTTWLAGTEPGLEPFSEADLEIYLAVPQVNPRATQMRAQVRGRDQSFVVFTSIHPADWQAGIGDENVGILENATYPDAFGFRAGDLLVKGAEGVSEEGLARYMRRFGATGPEPFAASWWVFRMPPFSETGTREDALGSWNASRYVREIRYNEIVEWIALRERVIAFSLTSP